MLRILKYLKPYLVLILLSIGLLFVQANADLALPDYLSRIVNIGIQQGGVEGAVPEAIRQVQMDRLLLFLGADDRAAVLDAYTLVDDRSPGYAAYREQYPALDGAAVYVRKPLSPEELERLGPIMGKGLVVTSFLEQLMSDPAQAQALAQAMGFDLSALPAGMDLYSLLQNLPAQQMEMLSARINENFDALGESMIVQMAVGAVKAEYDALGMNTDALQSAYLLHTGGQMLLVTLLSVACTIAVAYLSAKTAAGLARDLRRKVFTRVEDFSSAEFDQFSTASLITRSTNDITQVQMVVIMLVRMVFYAPIIGIGGIIRALGKDTSMWWIIALAVGILLTMILIVYVIALPKFKSIQRLIDRLNLVMRENLSGMMVIRAFNRQDFELERFDRANQDLTGTMLFVNRIMVIMMPLIMLIMNGLAILIIWVGSHQVAQANMQVGDMMAFLQYAIQIVFAFLMMSIMFIILPRASVSAGRIADVLETEPTIKDPQEPKQFAVPFKGTIEFRKVSFRYPGADTDVLHDINFTIQPGQTTAFIGSTGSGKSTLVNLIPRFYDVTAGAILVNGMDVRQVRQHDLRARIGYVPQKGTLFSGTIASNLRYADEQASEELLKEAAGIAQVGEFIDSRPEGLEAEISQGGMNVSGGQKQRLAIARALVARPPIFIFDDSFSALDFKTDAALRRALQEKTAESALLIVTQRVSTIKNAEQIIVLDEGKVVGMGTHQALMQDCETYREIALSQLSKEELA
ncbi:MAG: ABC transporter ATP-binding protein [Anaerolineales bacterium]|nr:ABC transporter ATP-binding protein [Anaerolineales bacterium]